MKVSLISGLIIFLVACYQGKTPVEKETTQNTTNLDTISNRQNIPVSKQNIMNLDTVFNRQTVTASNGDILNFEFRYDSSLNIHVSVKSRHSYSSVGVDYTNFANKADGTPLIRKCKLSTNNVEEYYMEIGSSSSNYDNTNFLIVWFDKVAWYIQDAHLYRGSIEDYDGDGISEIIERPFYPRTTITDEDVYFFNKGNIIPYKFKNIWNKPG